MRSWPAVTECPGGHLLQSSPARWRSVIPYLWSYRGSILEAIVTSLRVDKMIHFSQEPLSCCCYCNPVSLLIDAWSDANELQSELRSPIPLQGKLEKDGVSRVFHKMERHWRSRRAPNSNTSEQRTSVFLWFLYAMQKHPDTLMSAHTTESCKQLRSFHQVI